MTPSLIKNISKKIVKKKITVNNSPGNTSVSSKISKPKPHPPSPSPIFPAESSLRQWQPSWRHPGLPPPSTRHLPPTADSIPPIVFFANDQSHPTRHLLCQWPTSPHSPSLSPTADSSLPSMIRHGDAGTPRCLHLYAAVSMYPKSGRDER